MLKVRRKDVDGEDEQTKQEFERGGVEKVG